MTQRPPGDGGRGNGGGAPPARERPLPELARRHNIDPFTLFCAYHLGITADDRYEFQNIHQVAKRFGTSAGVIKQLLSDLGMDTDAVVNSDFDMASAQVDVMRVPDGVSRTEIAREHYEAFMNAPRGTRDWKRELEVDARENEKTFGPSRAGNGNGSSGASGGARRGGAPVIDRGRNRRN